MIEIPEIIVSIDLGTTFTGVAWRTPRTPIQVINDWPDSGDRGERKVPTAVVYNADGTLSSWGFGSADDDELASGKTRREFFKIFLDRDTLAAAQQQGLSNAPQSIVDAQRFTTDFLRQVYIHIKETIEMQIGRRQCGGWTDMVVRFLFSVPTTWTQMEIVNIFKGIIRDAGFGIEGSNHSAQIDLTEAEAAAVATLKSSAVNFTVGSLFLVVDAGGGTTDLALMRTTSADLAFPHMSQMAAVKGVGIGSTLIDRAFIRLVAQRLAAYPDCESHFPADFAVRMSRSHHFQTLKHKFGQTVYMQPVFKIQMEGVAHSFSHTGLGVDKGRMLFTVLEIQALFDTQIEGIMRRITEQLDWLSTNGHTQQVEYMILSGGLGSSVYVREQIQQRLIDRPHRNAARVAVISSQDPQLVVIRGLLLEQQQRIESNNVSVLATRIARANYGVLVKEAYTPACHFDEELIQDQYKPEEWWAVNQIHWLIRKGDSVDPNVPLVHQLSIRLGSGDATRSWDTEIIISQNEPSFLPTSMKQAGVTKLCLIKSNLEGVRQNQLQLNRKRKLWFGKGHKFYVCQFEIHVIVAPADLRFELWFDGQRFSGNHEPIAVKWDEVGARVKGE